MPVKPLAARRARQFALKPLAALILGALALPAQADELTGLGFLPGGSWSYATGVSADGSVVVGESRYTGGGGNFQAFRWTGGVMTGLGFLGTGSYSGASGVSADGSVVVGESQYAPGSGDFQAFRWTGGVMTGLGFLGTGTWSYATDASADGSVVVGGSRSAPGSGDPQAFRWTGGVMTGLGFLPGGTYSSASGVSADGSVVVGGSDNGSNFQAFRWTGGAMTGLGFLGTGTWSQAIGVSADGLVVVGESINSSGNNEAFRWTGGAMTGLGFLGTGTSSRAYGVSADGSVVVGAGHNGSFLEAFRWTQATSMQSVAAWLAGAGVSIGTWRLNEASGVNGNGTVVVGGGQDPGGNNQAWLARVGPAGSGFLGDIPAFNATLAEAGGHAVQAGAGLPNLAMFGAHHRSLLDSGLARSKDGACAWATADAARHNASDTRMELAEAGVCKDIGAARLGVGVGTAQARQGWSLAGGAKYDGQYLYAEAANAFGKGLEGSLAGYTGRFDTRLNRNYMNGASVDTSSGRPDAQSTALRLRVDWKDVANLGAFSLSPYAAYTWMETKLDAYTETGGGFPAQFAAAKWRTNDLRLGAAGKTALSAATDLRLGAEVAHRFDDSTNGVNGQVVGLWSFGLPGQKVEQTWGRVTADVDHRLSKTTALTAGANAASNGGDATWGVTAGLRMNF